MRLQQSSDNFLAVCCRLRFCFRRGLTWELCSDLGRSLDSNLFALARHCCRPGQLSGLECNHMVLSEVSLTALQCWACQLAAESRGSLRLLWEGCLCVTKECVAGIHAFCFLRCMWDKP